MALPFFAFCLKRAVCRPPNTETLQTGDSWRGSRWARECDGAQKHRSNMGSEVLLRSCCMVSQTDTFQCESLNLPELIYYSGSVSTKARLALLLQQLD